MLKEVQEHKTRGRIKKVHLRPHAWNLHAPTHMEWSSDGRLYVSEHTSGTIRDITRGGDASRSRPVARGLEGPAAVKPRQDGTLLVTETWGDRLSIVGPNGKRETIVEDLQAPYALGIVDPERENEVIVSESESLHLTRILLIDLSKNQRRIILDKIPARHGEPGLARPGDWPDWERHAAAGCVKNWIDPLHPRYIHVAVGAMGQIIRVPKAKLENATPVSYADFISQAVEAVVVKGASVLGGIYYHEPDDHLYWLHPLAGELMAAPAEGCLNVHFTPPLLRGLRGPTCVRPGLKPGTFFVCSSADGVVWEAAWSD